MNAKADCRGCHRLGDAAAIVVLVISFMMSLLLAPHMAQAKVLKPEDVTFSSASPCVSDNAHILDGSVSASVTALNAKWEKKADGAQLAVVTVDSLPDNESIEDYSMALAEHIKPGQKGKDNGLLYLVVKDTHQDRLEVGYGLEDKVTDSKASDILTNAHVFYKKKNWSGGVESVMSDLKSVVGGGYAKSRHTTGYFGMNFTAFCLVVGVVLFLLVLYAFRKKRICIWVEKHPDSDFDDDDFWSGGSSSSHSSFHSSSHSSSHSGGFGGGSFGGGGASGSW